VSDFHDDINQHAANAAGMDTDEMHRVQQVLLGNAQAFLTDFVGHMAEHHRISAASSTATIMQVALHGIIFAAPGAPVTDWARALCDTLDREMAGKPPLPAQIARLQKHTLAVMTATRDRIKAGRMQ
jgi:hypothetical protein